MVKLEIGEECEQGPMSECGLAEAAAKAAALSIPFNALNMDAVVASMHTIFASLKELACFCGEDQYC